MSYVPNPAVYVNDVEYTGNTIGSISLTRGRRQQYEVTNAGYAAIELLFTDGQPLPIQVGQSLSVAIDNSTGAAQTIFTGFVSDWSGRVRLYGDTELLSVSLQGVGPLAKLHRRNVFAAGRPSEDDGARVLAALQDGFALTWDEVSLTLAWSAVGTAVTWTGFDPFDTALIDDGVYLLADMPVSDSGYNALQAVQGAADSGQGVLYETPSGDVGYADANRRPALAQAGFLQVPATVLTSEGLGFSSQLSDVTNRVTVEYDGGAVQVDDEFSIETYTVLATTLGTELANLSNAEALASGYLLRHASPQVELDQVRINLATCGTALRDDLVAVNTNDAIELTQLPGSLGLETWQGFVEGVEWDIDQYKAELGLDMSAAVLSFGAERWGQVTDTITWSAVGTALSWAGASQVTV